MKLYLPVIALAALVISSCTSAYKTGQTPDDVYFSPTRDKDEYVVIDKRDDRRYNGSEDYYEDRFIRMRMMDRYRWSALDDYYFYNSYAYTPYGHYYNWNSPWNAHWAWNSYYNPYCGIPYFPGTGVIKNPRYYTPPSRAVAFNPNSYIRSGNTISPTGNRTLSNSYSGNRYNNSNSNSNRSNSGGLGQSIRKVFSNENSGGSYNPGNNSSTPSRSYTPSSSSSSSSSGSRGSSGGSSGGGGVSRPPR